MNNQELLIREAHDDNKVMDDFISRKDFINRTGIFVTYDYFHDFVYDEFKESGVTVDEFVKTFEKKHSGEIEITEFPKEFKHMALCCDMDSVLAYKDDSVTAFPNLYEFMDITDARSAIWREAYEEQCLNAQKLIEVTENITSITEELFEKCDAFSYIETELNKIADMVKNLNDESRKSIKKNITH